MINNEMNDRRLRSSFFGFFVAGVGYADLAISMCTINFYTVVLALCLHYLGHSFSATLPWTVCHDASYYREGVPNSIFLKDFKCVMDNGTMRGNTTFPKSDSSNETDSKIVSTVELFYRCVKFIASNY